MKRHVTNGDEPWSGAFQLLLSWKGSSLNWSPTPFENVHRDSYGANRVGDPAISNDGEAAYSHALQWVISEDTAHVEKAIAILNVYLNANNITNTPDRSFISELQKLSSLEYYGGTVDIGIRFNL